MKDLTQTNMRNIRKEVLLLAKQNNDPVYQNLVDCKKAYDNIIKNMDEFNSRKGKEDIILLISVGIFIVLYIVLIFLGIRR